MILLRNAALASAVVAVAALLAFTLHSKFEYAAQGSSTRKTPNDPGFLNSNLNARDRNYNDLRDEVIAKIDQHTKFRDLEEEFRVLAAPNVSPSARISLLRILAESKLNSLEFEKVVDLFCMLDSNTEFCLSAVDLISAGSKRAEITQRIFSMANEGDLQNLADSFSRIQNDRERQILVRQLAKGVLRDSSPLTLYQWITENLDQSEQLEATGTVFSTYAEMLGDSPNVAEVDFEFLAKQFPLDVLQPVTISGLRIFAERGDVTSAMSILNQYPPSGRVSVLHDSLAGMNSISTEAARVFEVAINSTPEEDRPSMMKLLNDLSE